MTDRPIIFSAPMIQALLAGRKTQTRRVLGGSIQALGREPAWEAVKGAGGVWRLVADAPDVGGSLTCNERYAVGDRLWVREKVRAEDDDETWDRLVCYLADDARVKVADQGDNNSDAFGRWWLLNGYRSDDPDLTGGKPVPSIHMPRWASRLTLVVTEVRVERLKDISEADAIAEGIERSERFVDRFMTPSGNYAVPIVAFQRLWESIHGAEAWAANPWVVAVTFGVHRANIDALEAGRIAA